jgi:hypothetical protein
MRQAQALNVASSMTARPSPMTTSASSMPTVAVVWIQLVT